jgi:ABC-type sugar transport system substrate-binding protein
MKMLLKCVSILVVLVFVLSLAGCASSTPQASASPAASASAPAVSSAAAVESSAAASAAPSAAASTATGKTPQGGKAIKNYVIGVSPLTTQHEYYIGYLNGIKKAAADRGVTVVISDPNWDVATQTSQIEDFVSQKVDAIICSPTNPQGIKPALVAAQAAGIPVLVEMTLIDGVYPLIGTDQYAGAYAAGKYAGEWAVKNNGGKGKAALLDYPYFQNCLDRAKGYKEGLAAAAPNVQWVTAVDCKATMEGALKTAEDILQAHPDINIMFGINGDSAKGAAAAYESAGTDPSKICVCGFDADEGERKIIYEKGYIKASVAADGNIIGADAIDAAIRKIEGADLGKWVKVRDEAQYLVTSENIDKYYTPKK